MERCSDCSREVRVPLRGGLCATCEARRGPKPSYLDRGGKWGPLQLGCLSLVFDLMMIPTVLAVSRAVGDLREVARAEADGQWHPAHERARTDALWGATLALGRAFALVVLLSAVMFMTIDAPTYSGLDVVPPAPMVESELDDILPLYERWDEEAPALARRQLMDILRDPGRRNEVRAALRDLDEMEEPIRADYFIALAGHPDLEVVARLAAHVDEELRLPEAERSTLPGALASLSPDEPLPRLVACLTSRTGSPGETERTLAEVVAACRGAQ